MALESNAKPDAHREIRTDVRPFRKLAIEYISILAKEQIQHLMTRKFALVAKSQQAVGCVGAGNARSKRR